MLAQPLLQRRIKEDYALGSSGPTIPTAGGRPQESPSSGGKGVGEGDDDPQRSPTRPGHGAPPGWVCARPRHPPILQLARSRLEEPGHDRLGGRGLGASWRLARSRPPKAPHGLLLARPRQGPMPRCDSESNDVADGIEDMEFTDVKDCEEHADRPPKSLGGGPRVFWGRVSPGPRQLWGPRPGGASPARRRAHEGLQPGGPCPVNAHDA